MTFRYRQLAAGNLDPGGELDMTFGRGSFNFLADSEAAVAQSIYTRLCLWLGEWYLNTAEGTPWLQQILGHRPSSIADAAIRTRIQGTAFVTHITDYASYFDPTSRVFTVGCKVDTSFGLIVTPPPGSAISPAGALVMPFGSKLVKPQQQPLSLRPSFLALPPPARTPTK